MKVAVSSQKSLLCPTTNNWGGKTYVHAFPKGIRTKSNANSLVQDFELGSQSSFPITINVTPRSPPWRHECSDIFHI